MSSKFQNFKVQKKVRDTTRCGGIIFNQNLNKIILVENNYLYVKNNLSVWGLPKGLINTNETFNKCAMREIFEETGIDIKIESKQPYLKLNNNYYFPIKINENELINLTSKDKKEIRTVRWFNIENNKIDEDIKINKDLKIFLNKYLYRAKNIAKMFKTYEKNYFSHYTN